MSQRTVSDSLKSRLRRIPDSIEDQERPKFSSASLLERIDPGTLVSFPRQHAITIDTFPDTRFLLLFITWNISSIFSSGNFRDNMYITPASLTAYCLQLVYGFAFLCDSCYRHVPSPSADEILSLERIQALLDILANCYVPPFLVPVLTALLPHTLDSYAKFDFVTTLGCYHFATDFGRILPASIFFAAHNAICSLPSNSTPHRINYEWFATQILNITGTNALVVQVNDYLSGAIFTGTDANYMPNWFNTRMFALNNPITSRFQSARPTFSPIPIDTFTSTWSTFNPYLFNIGIVNSNYASMFNFLKTTSEYVKSNHSAGLTMTHICESSTGSLIINHLYSGPALPTWCDLPALGAVPVPFPTYVSTSTSTAQQATRIGFLAAPSHTDTHLDIGYPADTTGMTLPAAIPVSTANNLPATLALQNAASPAEYYVYDDNVHSTPNMLLVNSRSSPPSSIFTSALAGLMIENGNVDGFGSLVENIDMSVNDNNAQLLGAAVLGSTTILGLSLSKYHAADNHSSTPLAKRPIVRMPKFKNAILIRDMSRNYYPTFYKQVLTPFPVNSIGTIASSLGLRLHANHFPRTVDAIYASTRRAREDTGSSLTHRALLVWSSYRVHENEEHSYIQQISAVVKDKNIGHLVSLRQIFGASSVTGKIIHPSAIIL